MCHTLLQDSKLYALLLLIDEERAAEARAAGCGCGGPLHSARYLGNSVLPDGSSGVHEKKRAITLDMITAQIELGAGTRINFRSSLAGHPQCNRYGLCLVVNGRLYDALDEPGFIARIQAATAHLVFDRANPRQVIRRVDTSVPYRFLSTVSWTPVRSNASASKPAC